MIQVNDVNKTKELASGSKAKKSSGGDNFSLYLKETMKPAAAPIGGSSNISVADAIFATQMVSDDEEKEIKKQLVKKAKTLIEKLEEIRDGLLLGYISKDRLIEISRFVKEHKFISNDEKLMEILNEVELRVEVELAKLMK